MLALQSSSPGLHSSRVLTIATPPLFINFSFSVIPLFILNSLIPLSLSLNLNLYSPRSPLSLLLLTAYFLLPKPQP